MNPSDPPPMQYPAYASPVTPIFSTPDDRSMALLAHLLGIFTGFVGPLIIWVVKKDTSPFATDQAKEALNFQLTLLIWFVVGVVTAMFCVGFFIVAAAGVFGIVMGIIAGVAANRGELYRYPMTIRMVQ